MYWMEIDGEPVKTEDPVEWSQWFKTADRKIDRTQVGPFEVSTVFLAVDHNLLGDTPVLYETMVFPVVSEPRNALGHLREHPKAQDGVGYVDFNEVYTRRYATRADAERGHEDIVLNIEVFGRPPED